VSIVTVTVTGLDAVKKKVAALTATTKDLTGFWRDVFAPKYFGVIQDLFKTSGTPRGEGGKFSGAPWEKYSPAYAIWKYKTYPGQPILTATGRLRNSLAWGGNMLGPEGIFTATPKDVTFGSAVPYAAALHYGAPSRNLPARPFLIEPDSKVFSPLLKQWLLKMSGTDTGLGG
jgi:phage gpG-like protein